MEMGNKSRSGARLGSWLWRMQGALATPYEALR
jgi:hypothetical protein